MRVEREVSKGGVREEVRCRGWSSSSSSNTPRHARGRKLNCRGSDYVVGVGRGRGRTGGEGREGKDWIERKRRNGEG